MTGDQQEQQQESRGAFTWTRKRGVICLVTTTSCCLLGVLLIAAVASPWQSTSTTLRHLLDRSSSRPCQPGSSESSCAVRRRRRVQASNNNNNNSKTEEEEDDKEEPTSSSSSSSYSFPHGCLYHARPERWTTPRVCNSQDSPNVVASGACRVPSSSSLQEEEVRIFAQDWESSVISAWLLQMILSELLGIPTSIETGVSESTSASVNFYYDDPSTDRDGENLDYVHHVMPMNAIDEALENVHLFQQDCRLARSGSTGEGGSNSSKGEDDDSSSYQPCAHYIPESWQGVSPETLQKNQNFIDTIPMGLQVQQGWYIPKFTAQRDATLTSYIGMQMAPPNYSKLMVEENSRRHLADTFLRPTTWLDYCNYVSWHKCAVPDQHAQRAPITVEEGAAYYYMSPTSRRSRSSSSGKNSTNSTNSDAEVVDVLYTGHFQKSGLNDCDNHPTACTGHMGDYPPCTSWTSYVPAQTHHLNIHLDGHNGGGTAAGTVAAGGDSTTTPDGTASSASEPQSTTTQSSNGGGGYSIQQLQQLWHAANATQSNLVMMWYDTSLIHYEYQATSSEFIKVTLPPTTQECLDNRMPSAAANTNNGKNNQCRSSSSSDLDEKRLGSPLGACDYPVQTLYKIVVKNSIDTSTGSSLSPETAVTNPAYAVMKDFTLSNAQLSDIYDYWIKAKTAAAAAANSSSTAAAAASPRQALCQWAADNMEHLESFLPPYYPRTLVDEPQYASPVLFAAVFLASLVLLVVILVTFNVVRLRQHPGGVMQAGPLHLLYVMLVGAMSLGVGALLAALPVTNGTCAAEIWLVNWGWGVLGLVPILVKLRAIRQQACTATTTKKTVQDEQTITTATTTTVTRNNRVVPSAKNVYGAVFLVGVAVSIVLIVWTILDPPQKQVAGYSVMTDLPPTAQGETIVHVSYYCSSNQIFWNYLSIAWNMFLLAGATVLVWQTNKIRQDFNEPALLAVLVYCHSVFVMLWLISMLLSTSSSASSAVGNDGTVNQSSLTGFRSIVFSLDALVTLLVYFVPKFVVRLDGDDNTAAGAKSLGPIALWISSISGVSACKAAAEDSAEKSTRLPPPAAAAAAPKSSEQAPRAIPAATTSRHHDPVNTTVETPDGIETTLGNGKATAVAENPYSSDGNDVDNDDVGQLRASVDRLKREGQYLRTDVETKDRTIALLESEVESLMEICMNHPRRGGHMDPSETADDSENYVEESPFLVETTLKHAAANAAKNSTDDDSHGEEHHDDEEEPAKIQAPKFAETLGKGNFDYSLSTIYEDVDLAQLRDDEAKLLEQERECQKAAVMASTPRELSKRKMVERAQEEVDV